MSLWVLGLLRTPLTEQSRFHTWPACGEGGCEAGVALLTTSSAAPCEVRSSCSRTPNAVRGAALPTSCSCAQQT